MDLSSLLLERFSYFVEPIDGTFFGSDSAAQHEVLMQCGAIERRRICEGALLDTAIGVQ
ncbi:Uncharacterised protein [Mycobacterium tuberculosis]|uniref:Uncharacterized protein n=1 Tax=Mycobacterium tuberculosis TaxID=1773 RepID=A0A0T7PKW4_MYCTX|nr:Uncharacterised protein [Mycobacterium tuberculosis]CFS03819.1 Uncharacterised protein [Mycobacterium tuberculosis]CKT39739.1 Uncharacterised protein [Mycobacterium tuberculosis]CNV53779.1 Uncharacterised protein [Mycobacterium tuberculosis]COW26073.1 Uncharacterised protein [Mycobacterium tuberculosis]